MPDTRSLASFGYRDVPEAEKEGLVHEVFSSVAGKYDLMNDLMSGGVHRLWKDAMVEWLNPRPGWRVLDVAGGTGDIAFRIAELVRARGRMAAINDSGGEADVTVCDINADMVGEGLRRALAKGERAIRWIAGNAEALPIPDASMDAYTIAFGIRNVTHIDRALSEARRVLKPGGRFLCLEFSRVEAPGLDALYDAYSMNVLPRLGQMVAGDADAYRYLAESIRRFPPQAKFAKLIEQAGLSHVKVRNLTGGVAAMHSAWKI
ncbi:MAG TPA: bifunctional demethylmenaquinone methyltransferase/2-methoxy-6-polyprenyl-1,4-benzoquinol methylase UbiE [Rhizomicrobium sp.]